MKGDPCLERQRGAADGGLAVTACARVRPVTDEGARTMAVVAG